MMSIVKSRLTLTLGSIVLAASCSSGGFEGAPKTGKVAPVEEPVTKKPIVEPEVEIQTETFDLELQKTDLDMVWVIDNSGSMSNEAKQVQENFSNFLTNVGEETNLKVALISAANRSNTAPYPVSLTDDDIAKGHIQIDEPVGSYNSLALLASASCPKDSTELFASNGSTRWGDGAKICSITDFTDNSLENAKGVQNRANALSGFYRRNSTKVFVFVTDDNARTIDGDSFMSALSQLSTPLKPTVYTFSSLEENACKKDENTNMSSSVYNDLAAKTIGESFDICTSDWKQYFSKLTESVVLKANSKFTLKTAPERR